MSVSVRNRASVVASSGTRRSHENDGGRVPTSGARIVVSGPARIHAQLRDPGNPGDGYHHTPTDGGDQQRHSKWEGTREAQVVNLDARRVLQNEDNEHRQEQERGSSGHPGGADAS